MSTVGTFDRLGFRTCTADQLVPITASQGIWQTPPGQFPTGFGGAPGRARRLHRLLSILAPGERVADIASLPSRATLDERSLEP
jgi:hypothetical protein